MYNTLYDFLQSPIIVKALSSSTTLTDFLSFCESENYIISNQDARILLKIPQEFRDDDCILYIFVALNEVLQEQGFISIENEELQVVSGGINYMSAYQSSFVPVSFNVANSLGQTVSNTFTQVQAANHSEQLEQFRLSERQRIDDYKKSLQF